MFILNSMKNTNEVIQLRFWNDKLKGNLKRHRLRLLFRMYLPVFIITYNALLKYNIYFPMIT